MPYPEFYRPYLTILMWGLICEIMVMMYYIANNRYSFEFYLVFAVFLITLEEVMRIIINIRKKVREEL